MTDHAEVTRGEDPTQAILSESALHEKYLCDYVVNVATGCAHSCKFCYVPATPNIRTRGAMLKEHADVDDGQAEWGGYVLYRDEIPDKLPGIMGRKRTWKTSDKGRGIVGISFSTDCYMDKRAGDITTEVVRILTQPETTDFEYDPRPARILTRNPMLASSYMDVFKAARPNVIVGTSIPTFNEDQASAIESNAPSIASRLRGLERFAEAGVPVYVSMSPTYPTLKTDVAIGAMLDRFSKLDPEVVFHEPINPRGANFAMTVEAAREAGEDHLADSLEEIRETDAWVRYACTQFAWSQRMADKYSVPIHLWPDKSLVKNAPMMEAQWLQAWRDRQSPEAFAGRETPTTPPPTPPRLFTWEDQGLE